MLICFATVRFFAWFHLYFDYTVLMSSKSLRLDLEDLPAITLIFRFFSRFSVRLKCGLLSSHFNNLMFPSFAGNIRWKDGRWHMPASLNISVNPLTAGWELRNKKPWAESKLRSWLHWDSVGLPKRAVHEINPYKHLTAESEEQSKPSSDWPQRMLDGNK